MKQRCKEHPFYYKPCKICKEISNLENRVWLLEQEVTSSTDIIIDYQKDIADISESLEQALNSAGKSYNPEANLKLSVHDLNMVRGVFVANSFLFNSLAMIKQCIENKKDEYTKDQLIAIEKDLEKEWQRVVDLLKVFAKSFSNSNWNRMINEVQKVTQLSVDTMNSRDLGAFTVGKETESLSVEYDARPGVTAAVNKALSSAGTNNLTAYSKEILIQEITKLMEEK
jgi:hypothetical protein